MNETPGEQIHVRPSLLMAVEQQLSRAPHQTSSDQACDILCQELRSLLERDGIKRQACSACSGDGYVSSASWLDKLLRRTGISACDACKGVGSLWPGDGL